MNIKITLDSSVISLCWRFSIWVTIQQIYRLLYLFLVIYLRYLFGNDYSSFVCCSTPVIGSLLVFNHAETSKQSSSGEKFLLLCDFFIVLTFKFEYVKLLINWLESLGWERISSDSLIRKLVKELRKFESIYIKKKKKLKLKPYKMV